jgi:hypothetical protein
MTIWSIHGEIHNRVNVSQIWFEGKTLFYIFAGEVPHVHQMPLTEVVRVTV